MDSLTFPLTKHEVSSQTFFCEGTKITTSRVGFFAFPKGITWLDGST